MLKHYFSSLHNLDPAVTVIVDDSGVTPVVGSAYSLNCTVTGVDRLTDANITYFWWKDGIALLDQTAGIMFFKSLNISDAGEYECSATITSSFISAPITVQNSLPLAVTLTCMLHPTYCHPKV